MAKLSKARSFFTIATIFTILALSANGASAADIVLMDNKSDTCGNCYDGWQVNSGADQWIAFVVQATSAATVTKVDLYMAASAPTKFSGSTVSFYRGGTESPNNISRKLGDLTYSSAVSRGLGEYTATFTGSVEIPSSGLYWFRFGNLSAGNSVNWYFGGLTGITGDWIAYQGSPNDVFFDGAVQRLLNYYPAIRITGQSLASVQPSTDTSVADARKAAAEIAKREQIAKENISQKFSAKTEISKADIDSTGLYGASDANISLINQDLSKIAKTATPTYLDLTKIIVKYKTIDKISTGSIFYASDLVAGSFLDKEDKSKSLIHYQLAKVNPTDLDTEAKLRSEITKIKEVIEKRTAAMAALRAKYRL